MYIPQHYKNEDLSEVKDFIAAHSFGILVNDLEGKPWATHTPLELSTDNDGRDILIGHIAKANPQWRAFSDNPTVLCIFNGAHSYVSSSWYKEEEVPTWNYIAVHVYGSVEIMSEEEVFAWLSSLVDHHEAGEKEPVSLHRMSDATLRQVRGVMGFRIRIDEIQAAYKLSQGREEDHPRIISELASKKDQGSREISQIMKKRSADK
ncbi:FMN-binding negative transcriptional regulator [Muriicola marianensis]|uniref:Protease synthase and sporulation protein PAI 2 n=1 Tax=Muriicola marianensis TaxID=1324801 RepID=A0ABQ1R8N7_9FLAO|nr:FMN-binding negative transcriptional regulator [Muriicola marianensis]GGD58641.1 protease synthase and sporulation protein PAI 2 [Muriicola marianensis]